MAVHGAFWQYCCMVFWGYKFVLVGLLFCVVGRANAARMDISRLTHENEFSVTVGAYYQTGLNAARTHQSDFLSGHIDESNVALSYTPIDDLTLNFTTSNNYADAQVGLAYKIIAQDPIKLDFLTDYGIAWTRDALTDMRNGANNVDFGVSVTGVATAYWQWAISALGQYVWASPSEFWNINLTAQLMYYFASDLAMQATFNFNFLQINLDDVMYDKTVTLGMVYNFTESVSVNPFVKYHFQTAEYKTNYVSYYNYFQIGVAMSAQF